MFRCALPALLRAEKLQKRLASVGFDWDSAERVLEKVAEEAAEIVEAQKAGAPQAELEDEIGDLLFVVANLARHLKVDPEARCAPTNAKVMRRWAWIEAALRAAGPHGDARQVLEEMEALWHRGEDEGVRGDLRACVVSWPATAGHPPHRHGPQFAP